MRRLYILLRGFGLFVYLRLLQMTLPSEFIVADQCAGNLFGFASKETQELLSCHFKIVTVGHAILSLDR